MTSHLTIGGAVGYGDATLVPAGTTQATATPLTTDHVHCPTVSANTGIILKAGNGGSVHTISNGDAANSLNVYPPVGSAFNGAAVNIPLVLPKQRGAFIVFVTPTIITAVY